MIVRKLVVQIRYPWYIPVQSSCKSFLCRDSTLRGEPQALIGALDISFNGFIFGFTPAMGTMSALRYALWYLSSIRSRCVRSV